MLKRNKYKKKIKVLKRNISKFIKKNKAITIAFFLLAILFIWIKIAYNHYINNPKNLVRNVFFQKKIINNPDLTGLVKYTQNVFSWTNTVKNKFLKYQNQINLIKKKYPFVKKIYTKNVSNNSIEVDFIFKKPLFTFIGSWNVFAVYNKNLIYKFSKKYLSGIILSKEKIYLPKYLLNKNNLNKIFWKNSPEKILNYYKQIKIKLPKSKIFYIAWWEYLKVIDNWKAYYFSLSKDIKLQLNQLEILKLKIPDKFNNSEEIDLGSLKNTIFLKQK